MKKKFFFKKVSNLRPKELQVVTEIQNHGVLEGETQKIKGKGNRR